ncbi:glycosyltransferase [Candidatus Margulisiibacteriota bacterium]
MVSVIIATHNHAHFLSECLNSVKQQTYPDYEVILVDNGSTDDTKEVVKKLSWDKLKYHYQENTGSVAGPRNTGLKLAKGQYVAFLDSDDFWYKNKLSTVIAKLVEDPAIDILTHDLFAKDENGSDHVMRVGPPAKDMFRHLLLSNRLLGSATVAKKSVMNEIGGFDGRPEFVHAEDYETWLRLAYRGKKFNFLNETLGVYRIHGGNLSRDFERASFDEINVLRRHLSDYRSKYPFDKFILSRRVMGRTYYWLGTKHLQNHRWLKGAFYIMRSVLLSPEYILKLFSSMKKYLKQRTEHK